MSFTIRAFVGANGGGKTLAAVEKVVLPAWREGRPVVANFTLRPDVLGFDPALYVPLTTWRQIPDLTGCALVLDEISSVLPSRQAMAVPPQLVRILNQLRKGDVQLAWTAPNWARCDVLLREVTQAVTVCRGMFPDRFERDDDGRKLGPHRAGWGPNRVFRWITFDAMEFDEFSYSTVKDIKPRARQWYRRTRHDAMRAYSTLEQVALLDHLDDVGTCVNCGGSRTRPKCSCKPTSAGPEGRQPVGPAAPAAAPVAMVDKRKPLGPVRVEGVAARAATA